MFSFQGEILASKSWLNRALIIQYFNSDMDFECRSEADDVVILKKAIKDFNKKNNFDLGLGGTSFRFFCFLISRFKGEYSVSAQSKLLGRPQQSLIDILNQLGVEVRIADGCFIIKSDGWKNKEIFCDAPDSSQFISGLLLSAWELSFPLQVKVKKPIASFLYLKMTIDLLKKCGMELRSYEDESIFTIEVPSEQKVKSQVLIPELDFSSAFSLVAAAIVGGQVKITNWSQFSIQPDSVFLKILDKMNISYIESERSLFVNKSLAWNGIEINLNDTPDLFPVLAVLCALARGNSRLYGATQLKHKESNRIEKTYELLSKAGFRLEKISDGLIIYGQSSKSFKNKFIFDPDHDHRMAMAAGVLKLAGCEIEISNPQVVTKSYNNFWSDIGINL